MSYLVASRSPSNLGVYRRSSAVPVIPQSRVPIISQPSRFRIGTRPVRVAPLPPAPRFGLGQDLPAEAAGALPLDTSNFPGASSSADLMPFSPTNYPPLPAQINAPYTTNTQEMNLDPLNFVSPQAAIAAGVNPQKAASAWTQAVASFPTQNAAVAAGIPAGVVTSLWASSRSLVLPPASGSWLDGSTFGIKNIYLVGGLGFVMLLAAGGKRGRR